MTSIDCVIGKESVDSVCRVGSINRGLDNCLGQGLDDPVLLACTQPYPKR